MVLAVVAVGACSTTHDLGPAADPATMSRIEALASEPGTTASVTPLPGRHGLHPTYAVTAATANGLMVSVGGDPPALLSYDRVRSLNRRDRLHGARNGGLAVAAVAFAVGFIVGAGATAFPACCAPPPSPARIGLEVGGVSALVGAVVGGAFGALAGYQDRYVLAPTETASAR